MPIVLLYIITVFCTLLHWKDKEIGTQGVKSVKGQTLSQLGT